MNLFDKKGKGAASITPALTALKGLVSRFEAALHQEKMYFEVTETRVELLPPWTEEGTRDE